MGIAFSRRALVVAVSVCMAASASAQTALSARNQQNWGRPSAASGQTSIPLATTNLGQISPAFTFSGASFGTGAVGLRNRGEGGISISGVAAPIQRAFAYWAVVTDGPPTASAASINMKRGVANGPFTSIAGTAIGSGPTPCWTGDRVTVYRGIIPLSLATGNGLYLIQLKPGANGSTAGQSPWIASVPPLFEGLSIVLVGTGTSTVAVYDTTLAGKMFFDLFAYKLRVPVTMAGASEVLFHNIGADGQTGVGVDDVAATAGEITSLNGRAIAGPGSPAGSGDWNGGVAAPLPQLWDNTTHDITDAAHSGPGLVLSFIIKAPDDCLVSVANIVSIKSVP